MTGFRRQGMEYKMVLPFCAGYQMMQLKAWTSLPLGFGGWKSECIQQISSGYYTVPLLQQSAREGVLRNRCMGSAVTFCNPVAAVPIQVS